MSYITRILEDVRHGDTQARDELFPVIYRELHRLAAQRMNAEAPGQNLHPTVLVHEAWLRLGGDRQPTWQNRAHFFAAAGEAMRRILIDSARRRKRVRHGGAVEQVNLDDVPITAPADDDRMLAVHEALDQLGLEDPVKADVVKLRFFVGLTDCETGEALGISERTVQRHWAYAKVWLLRAVHGTDSEII